MKTDNNFTKGPWAGNVEQEHLQGENNSLTCLLTAVLLYILEPLEVQGEDGREAPDRHVLPAKSCKELWSSWTF